MITALIAAETLEETLGWSDVKGWSLFPVKRAETDVLLALPRKLHSAANDDLDANPLFGKVDGISKIR